MAETTVNQRESITYADAGVNIDQANRTKQRIKYLAHKTFTKNVLSDIGSFGGMFDIDTKKYESPVLVSSVDGVGTKLKVAFRDGRAPHRRRRPGEPLRERHRRAGRGAAVLPGLLCHGQTATPEIAEKVVAGIAEACKHNGCALIGGETAEMPGFYPAGEYDLAGFIVGVVDREKIITGKDGRTGDVLVGAALERPAHQRLFAGPQTALRPSRVTRRTPTLTRSRTRSARR